MNVNPGSFFNESRRDPPYATADAYDDGSGFYDQAYRDEFYDDDEFYGDGQLSTGDRGTPIVSIPVLDVTAYFDQAVIEVFEENGFLYDSSLRGDFIDAMKLALVEAGFINIDAETPTDEWLRKVRLPRLILITNGRQIEKLMKSVKRWFYYVIVGC